MKTSELLYRAAELLERGWCQGTAARDCEGVTVSVINDTACQWCTVGAFLAVAYRDYSESGSNLFEPWYSEMASAFRAVLPDGVGISPYNDSPGRTQAEVVAKVREAAALAERKEAAR